LGTLARMARSPSEAGRAQLDEILAAAERHGRAGEPDHEVGDLRDALEIAWRWLTPAARAAVVREHFATHDRWSEQAREG